MKAVLRILTVSGLAACSALAALDTVFGEPAACIGLRQQLGSSSDDGSSASTGYSRAAQQAAINLQRARISARQAGCNSTLFSRGDPAQCARFKQNIANQSANLEKLRRTGGQSGRAQASRQRIVASLKANGCMERPRGVLDVLFRSPPKREIREANLALRQQVAPEASPKSARVTNPPDRFTTTYEGNDPLTGVPVKKGYRTLCVRTCDGYYFPISFSTQRKFFARDQNACSAMCPAAEAKVYFHAVPEQSSEDMVSVATNEPYAELPSAFSYRTAGTSAAPGCTCQNGQRPTGVVDAFAPAAAGESMSAMESVPALALGTQDWKQPRAMH